MAGNKWPACWSGYLLLKMNKTTAHIILMLVDIAALFACYYVYSEYRDISSQLNDLVESVMIQKPLGLYAVLIIVPALHATAFINIPDSRAKLANSSFIAFFVMLVVSALAFDSWFEEKITEAGYVYCEAMSESMRTSEFRVYLREGLECTNQN